MRKATAFRGGANKTASPCFSEAVNNNLATVPVEQLQWGCLTENPALRENDLSHPAKGGSTPAFACQHAAIAPLPCPNLQLVSQRQSNCELESFKKVQLQQGELVAK